VPFTPPFSILEWRITLNKREIVQGICQSCGKKARPDRNLCTKCAKKQAEGSKNRRKEAEKQGLCRACRKREALLGAQEERDKK